MYKIIISFLILFISALPILLFSQKPTSNCWILDSIFNNKIIRRELFIEDNSKAIRIVTDKNSFKDCNCSGINDNYEQINCKWNYSLPILFLKKIPFDFNSGEYIDILIYKVHRVNKRYEVVLNFVSRGYTNERIKSSYYAKFIFLIQSGNLSLQSSEIDYLD